MEKIKAIYEQYEKRWDNGYNMIKYLDENGDLCESRTSYSQLVSYALDMMAMLDAIKETMENDGN